MLKKIKKIVYDVFVFWMKLNLNHSKLFINAYYLFKHHILFLRIIINKFLKLGVISSLLFFSNFAYADPIDPEVELEFTKKEEACTKDLDLMACLELQNYYLGDNDSVDFEQALPYLKISCEGDDANSCFLLASMYTYGQNVTQNYEEATKLAIVPVILENFINRNHFFSR